MKELLLFQAGNIQFGLNLPLVKSIQGVNARFAEQAGSKHKLVQVMDGEELPLYDLPSIMTDETSSDDPMSQKVILVESHEHPIALGVDRVKQVVSVSSDSIHPLPLIFNGLPLSCFPRVLKHEDELILLLNPEEIENLEPRIPDTKTDTPNPEAIKSSFEEKETPGPMSQAASDFNDIPQDNSQKTDIDHGEPTSGTLYSESTQPGETDKNQPDLDDHLSETISIDDDFEEETISGFVKKAQIVREEILQKEPFQPEESILSDEQEHIEPELSALNAGLEDMTPDTEESDAHDTEKEAAVADVDETAIETSPYEDKVEAGLEGGHFETASVNPTTVSYDELPGEKQSEEEKDGVNEERQLISSIGIRLDSQDEYSSSIEEAKPVSGDVLSQVAAGQPEEIVSLNKTENAVEPQEPESTDPFRSAKEDKDMPLLPVGEVPYLFAAVTTESEPIPREPVEEVFLKEAEAMVETLEEESTDPFRSAKEDKDMPLLPVGEVPYLFAAITTESEPIPREPVEEVFLKEAEAMVEKQEEESTDPFRSAKEDKDMPLLPVGEVPYLFAAVTTESEPIPIDPVEEVFLKESEAAEEVPESESADHLVSAEEDTATLIMPLREEPSLVDVASIESEPISKDPSHATLLDASDNVTPASGNRTEKALPPTGLPQELGIDHGKQKDSYRGPVAAGVLALVAILLLSIWFLPKSFRVPEVVQKPIPMAYAVGEVRKIPEELLQAAQPIETVNQDLSQTPQPLNTGEKAISTAHTSQKAVGEIFKIETNDFTLTVERPTATEKNGRLPTSAGMTGKKEHSHIVVKNDTLWQIAERYLDDPFRYPELAERSRISNPNRIYPGDVVRIIKKNEQRKGKEGKS